MMRPLTSAQLSPFLYEEGLKVGLAPKVTEELDEAIYAMQLA